MRRTVAWWAAHVTHWALLYLAFVAGLDGALSVIKFVVWFAAVLSLVTLGVERPKPVTWARWVCPVCSWALSFITVFALAWFGHPWSAAAWAFFMAVCYGRNTEAAKS